MPCLEFQSRTGFPGHLATIFFFATAIILIVFQSRTGFPGHLALGTVRVVIQEMTFQSRTGFPGHLAQDFL